jgi:hypothetical protein
MPFNRFDPPGFVDDLSDPQKQAWSTWVSKRLDKAKDGSAPRPQFFNPLKNPPAADAVDKDISWTAFPRIIKITSPSDAQRWKAADASRDVQDEYCEWSVDRDDASGKITRVTFTSEAPEYWIFLAKANPAAVLQLYKENVNADVAADDLFTSDGNYRIRNRWNDSTTTGVMHLIQGANNLSAEIQLASDATILRNRNGSLLTGERELIECAHYGEPERFSDPHIGGEVNALARQKADITLANPVGLCIGGLTVPGWETPDGSNPLDYWKVVRGTKEKTVRAEYAVPKANGFTVSDITINGKNIKFGSQIADFITIKLTGLATRIGTISAPAVACVAAPSAALAPFEAVHAVPEVETVLEGYHLPTRR